MTRLILRGRRHRTFRQSARKKRFRALHSPERSILDFGRFSIYRRIFSNSSVDLPDTPFDNAILPNPDDKINAEENTEITQKSSYAMAHPTHKICSGERGKRADDHVCQGLAQKTPTIHFPKDGSAGPSRTIQKRADCLQQNGAKFRSAVPCQFGNNGVKRSVSYDQGKDDCNECARRQSNRRANQTPIKRLFLHVRHLIFPILA